MEIAFFWARVYKPGSTTMRKLKLIIAVLFLISPFAANAGLIAVVADVNAVPASNFSFYDAILGTNTSVAFSRNDEQQGNLANHYNSLAGVTAVDDASVLTAAILSGYDMLVVTRFFNNAIDYTAAEIAAISDWVSSGGTFLAILESVANSPNLTVYNNFLADIGSSISYNGGRSCETPFSDTANAEATSLGPLDPFTVACYNYLDGGTAVYNYPDGTGVAFDSAQSVPEPGTLALLGIGLFGMGLARRKKV